MAVRLARRSFLSQLSLAGLASCLRLDRIVACTYSSTDGQAPGTSKPAASSHALPSHGVFELLPLGSVRPSGWLKNQLRIQADGLSGHLGETWADVGPNSGWLGGTGESWERGPYYLDGLLPLAYLLEDERLKAAAQRFIDWTLEHQAPDGMIGPASNNDWWPRIVMLKALVQYQELTGDARVIPLMDRYFRYQLAELPTRPLRDWGRFRWQDEVLSVLWLYRRSGEPYLLDLAQLLRKQGYDWMAEFENFSYTEPITREFLKLNNGGGLKDLALSTHGVNNAQAVKAGVVWSQVSGADAARQASMRMILELEKYHGLPNGMFSCDEHLAGRDPSQGSELCSVVEYMFSLENCLAITGDASLGDRLERLAYNALPGTFTDDMWAHQYNQEPNQVECSLHLKPWTTDGPESNLYGLEPNFGCCTANFHQGWPKFAASLFMVCTSKSVQGAPGLAATAYAPCEVRTSLGGRDIHIVEETDYPFGGSVRLTVNPAAPLKFPLELRIPGWAAGSTIQVNGKPMPAPAENSFAQIDRVWTRGDKVEMVIPMEPRASRGFNDSIAVERGPLVFSYGIAESWVKLRDRGMTADWQVFPASQWNYALKIDPDAPAEGVTATETVVGEGPFTRSHAPVKLSVKARKLDNWRAEDGVANPLPDSPVESSGPEETITLIPYAAAKLRITAFPQCTS
jgi:hypothetical protein